MLDIARSQCFALVVTATLLVTSSGCAPSNEPASDSARVADTSSNGATNATETFSAKGWVDVTAPLDPATTPVYEGDAPMKFDFLKDMRRGDPLSLSVYSLGAHSGTHVDAPMHFIADGAAVDKVSLEPLMGPARVIVIADSVQAIDAAELERHPWKGSERILFKTRSSSGGWMESPTFHRDFAYVAPDAAQLLVDADVKLVGIDYISAEQFGAKAPLTHRTLLGKGIPVIEGLDLRQTRAGEFDLIVLPIKVRGHDGAPARALLRAK
jgi:arylformamidase